MTAAEFTALLLYGAAMSFSPGPNTALSAALAAQGGMRRALPFVASVPVGWALLFLLSTAGLGALMQRPAVRVALLLAASAYMLAIAWALARRSALSQADPARLGVGFAQGVALQFVNGKAWLNALTISAGWVAGAPDPVARVPWVLPVLLAFGFFSNLTYAAVGAVLRGWLAQGHRLLWFNRTLAALLVATAAWVAAGALG